MGSQHNSLHITEERLKHSDLHELGPENRHIILESVEHHCRESRDEIVGLHDAAKVIVADLNYFVRISSRSDISKKHISFSSIKQKFHMYKIFF